MTAEADRPADRPTEPETANPIAALSIGQQCVRACVAAAIYRSKYANQCTVATYLPTHGRRHQPSERNSDCGAEDRRVHYTIDRSIDRPTAALCDRSVDSPIRRATDYTLRRTRTDWTD